MAEVIGTIASIVTLFEVCVKGFEFVRTVQQHDVELRKLTIRLGIEHARLFTWGEAMGLLPKQGQQLESPLIHRSDFQPLILDTLKLIIDTLSDSERTRAKYGCRKTPTDSRSSSQQPDIAADVSARRMSAWGSAGFGGSLIAKKAVWAIIDQKKFKTLIREAKELIDGLQDITKDLSSSDLQREMIKSRVRQINDIPTLEAVSEVCRQTYPDISDTASTHAETLSSFAGRRLTVLDWTENLEDVVEEDEDEDDVTLEKVESMNIADLKRQCISTLYRNRRLRLVLKRVANTDNATIAAKELMKLLETANLTSFGSEGSLEGERGNEPSDPEQSRSRRSKSADTTQKDPIADTEIALRQSPSFQHLAKREKPRANLSYGYQSLDDTHRRDGVMVHHKDDHANEQFEVMEALRSFFSRDKQGRRKDVTYNLYRYNLQQYLNSRQFTLVFNTDLARKALRSASDKEFYDEMRAILNWFHVLSTDESTAAISACCMSLSIEQMQYLSHFSYYCATYQDLAPPNAFSKKKRDARPVK